MVNPIPKNPSTPLERVDAVVVGGGTAGLQASYQLARTGLRVVLLEKREEGRSGARWCNGVLDWQLRRAGLGLDWMPGGPQRGASHMISPTGAHRFTIDQNPIIEADMRALVDHLLGLSRSAGVDVRWGVSQIRVVERGGRVVALHAVRGGEVFALEAPLFVDAAGYRGVLRDQVASLSADCPPCEAEDLCSAQQLMLAIDDPAGARAYLQTHGAQPGDVVTQLASAGGYSTVNVGVDPSFEHVSVLAGSIPAAGVPSGPQLVRQVRDENPWMGDVLFGGGGTIPLRRVYDRFTAPGIALVGDAACQVMTGHGSGIGFGLIAGKVLAEAVTGAEDPGDARVLERYQAGFLREFGGILAGYDAVRRMSGTLGSAGIEALFELGIFSEPLVRPGLDQRLGILSPAQALDAGRQLLRRPDLARVVVPALFALGASRGLYQAYPARPRGRAWRAWQRVAGALLPHQAAGSTVAGGSSSHDDARHHEVSHDEAPRANA